MTARPTVMDVARRAGVSVATVDRVVNQRQPVRKDTAERVLAAAEALGYHASSLLKQRLADEVPACRLGFLLQKSGDHFYRALGEALATATRSAGSIRGRPVVAFMDELSPASIVASIEAMAPRVDALGLVAVDHPRVAAAIAALRARGVPTFALLSDLTAEARAGYVGVDDRKAGRTAGWMIAKAARQPGSVGVLVGSHGYLGHELREIGLRSYFREHAPSLRLLDALVSLEDHRIGYEATLELLRRDDDLVGIYVAGGGMEGAIRALREHGQPGRVVLVCNELTPETRSALIDGIATMVIATPVALLAARVVEEMAQAIGSAAAAPPAATLLAFELYVAENI